MLDRRRIRNKGSHKLYCARTSRDSFVPCEGRSVEVTLRVHGRCCLARHERRSQARHCPPQDRKNVLPFQTLASMPHAQRVTCIQSNEEEITD